MSVQMHERAPALHAERYFDESDIALVGTQTFGRLRALAGRGYKPEFAQSYDDCLLLIHPRKNFKYREMLLDSSGTVQWLHDEDFTMHFSRWEQKRFESFLRTVPMPGWWDRTQAYRERVCAFVVGATICAVLYFIVSGARLLIAG
jgi:hypothetical protein